MPDVRITRGYMPGAIGRVAELHASYYSRHWGFGLFFEARIATELAAFLSRYDEQRDGFWTVSAGERVDAVHAVDAASAIDGAIAIDGADPVGGPAHLRWFIVSDALRGKGAGNQLLRTALDFCRDRGYGRVYLWTFEGLHAARHLYEKYGFRLVQQQRGAQWGREVNEQRFELELADDER